MVQATSSNFLLRILHCSDWGPYGEGFEEAPASPTMKDVLAQIALREAEILTMKTFQAELAQRTVVRQVGHRNGIVHLSFAPFRSRRS
jgi:hypothetical protein